MLFDKKTANKQYKRYLKKGPSRVTKKIISQLDRNERGETLIDIGGGIGAIQWWFLGNGGDKCYSVDASTGYSSLAKEHAEKNKLDSNTHFIIGDFTDNATDLPTVDHVTLDKVICCYPDYQAILNKACDKSSKTITLSYPMDGIIADSIRFFGVLVMRLKSNPFKPFVHRAASIRELLSERGFELKEKELSFPWHIQTYIKSRKQV